MAILIRTDNTIAVIKPAAGTQWTKAELQALIGDYETGRTAGGDYMLRPHSCHLFDNKEEDEGVGFEEFCRWKPYNPTAAAATGYEMGDNWIFGDAVLIPKGEVLGTPEDDELFGTWEGYGEDDEDEEPDTYLMGYACSSDECGWCFVYGHPGEPVPPKFCPMCGHAKPERTEASKRAAEAHGITHTTN